MSTNTCPMCGGSNLTKLEDKLYRCNKCNMLTDCVDDGDVGYKPPERNASNKEEFEMRQAERRRKHQKRRQSSGLRGGLE